MKNPYTKMTRTDFDRALVNILDSMTGEQLLLVPGAYIVFSEHFNSEVLDKLWEEANPEETANN